MKNVFLSLGVPLLALSGCTLAPRYEQPAAPVADTWSTGDVTTADGSAITPAWSLGWRDAFAAEPRLQRLIALALEHNRDLRVALLRVEQARALYRIQRSDAWPQVEAAAAGLRQRVPAGVSPTGGEVITSQYSANVGGGFELDLFGRLRSLNQQAFEQYLATEQAQRAAHLALVSEVAVQYFAERALDESLAVAAQTLESAEASYRLSQRKYELGATSELDLRTAEAQVQAVRANLADLRRQRLQAENALTLMIGHSLPADLPAPQPWATPAVLAQLPAGLPADLLTRRPDVLQAEHELRAAHAAIGAARAAFFPAIRLTGSAGTISPELSGLFEAGTGAWSFAPQITLPLFSGGRQRANLQWSQLEREAEVARYGRTIQDAFREVSDALIARGTITTQVEALRARVSAEQRRQQLAETRYRQGLDSYLTVLAAQQDLYSAQQALIQARRFETTNLIGLYRALGGGWQAETTRDLSARTAPADAAPGEPAAGRSARPQA